MILCYSNDGVIFMNQEILFYKLSRSKFRSSFHLKEKDKAYCREKGYSVILQHAMDFVEKRLSTDFPYNDGAQTPMRGHPVFIAQHATATCCRGCLEKWYHIPKGRALTNREQEYIVQVIMKWICSELS